MQRKRSEAWKKSIIAADSSLRQALQAISTGGCLMACVVSVANRLEGIVTDSDARRLLLEGHGLDESIFSSYNANPVIGAVSMDDLELAALCEEAGVREIPLCDHEGQLVDIFVLGMHSSQSEAEHSTSKLATRDATRCNNQMLIMAGGKGLRLRAVVSDRPKPLAEIGKKPILETIISRATQRGIHRFFIAVNHMASMIEDHLSMPCYSGLDIQIVREDIPLGTAGAIGLIADRVDQPLLVTNADLLTTIDYDQILHAHYRSGADMTCVVRPHQTTIPFGVIDVNQHRIVGIREKPQLEHMVNAGIYVINPDICRRIDPAQRIDMPELMIKLIADGKRLVPFFLHEYWIDVGQPDDYYRANREFNDVFGE